MITLHEDIECLLIAVTQAGEQCRVRIRCRRHIAEGPPVATARPSPYQGVAADVEHVRPREAAVSMLASALARTSSDAIEKLMGASPDSPPHTVPRDAGPREHCQRRAEQSDERSFSEFFLPLSASGTGNHAHYMSGRKLAYPACKFSPAERST